jgi:hypothetical protein
MAIGGVLISDAPGPIDVLSADVAVMDAAWPQPVRTQVIANILAALAGPAISPNPRRDGG